MKKIALVFDRTLSPWKSCQKITPNLYASYQFALKGHNGVKVFDFGRDIGDFKMINLAREILDFAPEKIIFLDHRPSPALLIKTLATMSDNLPEMIVHLYGDFILDAMEWFSIEKILQENPVHFVCASEAQVKLLSSLVYGAEKRVSLCPFPVDTKIFKYKNRRIAEKKVFKILYTGRLSRQKNIKELIKYFEHYNKYFEPTAELFIAGAFDDLGVPYLNKVNILGQYYLEFCKLLESLPPDLKKKIHYVGELDDQGLVDIYHSCDLFVSLSTHNDEDFGMSPAEALCCGMPLVLSHWGGYSSFPLYGKAVLTLPFALGEMISSQKFLKACFFQSAQKWSREEISQTAAAHLSIEAVGKVVQGILSKEVVPFTGFSALFRKLISEKKTSSHPFMESGSKYSKLYHQIYRSYVYEQ